MPLAEHALVLIHSGSPRRLSASDYNARRAECEAIARLIAQREPTVASLRDVTLTMLEHHAGWLREVELRRAEHVVRENQRVLDMVSALDRGDLPACGRLLTASHRSLQILYEVSSPELDALVEIATGVEGVLGSRLTGAGFGGSTITLARRDSLDRLRRAVAEEYSARTGLLATMHVASAVDGVGLVSPDS